MKITALELKNIRSFKDLPKISFSDSINVFIGPNNSGKSTILHSILNIQQKNGIKEEDVTIGNQLTNKAEIQIYFKGNHLNIIPSNSWIKFIFRFRPDMQRLLGNNGNQTTGFSKEILAREPENLFYPYLSKRKVGNYSEIINEEKAKSITGDLTNLYAKIDRLINPDYRPGNELYSKACENILGFKVSTTPKGNGKQAVFIIHNENMIPLTKMGDGISNMLGLIVDLCIAEDKIFLIEEPENDIHPKALKELMKLILEKSNNNQFFITTHSNIVMKYLGVSHTKIFKVSNEDIDSTYDRMRLSKIQEISYNKEERRIVLEELGYDFSDYDLWEGWLFLEESSAEVIIREYLIPWFAEKLCNKIRTLSTGSTTKVENKFEDFNALFVFLHLEPIYKNKVWIYIDDGEEEKQIIIRLKEKYKNYDEQNFGQFSKHDFEEYYPNEFQDKVKKSLLVNNKQEKRELKKKLLEDLKKWIKEDQARAKEEFGKSAKEIIDILKRIETVITSPKS